MRTIALSALCLVCACDERPRVDPSPVTPIAPRSPRSPQKPVEPPTPPTRIEPQKMAPSGAVPTADDRAGPFRIHFNEGNGQSQWGHDVLIEGDARGATLTDVEAEVTRFSLDAPAVAALLSKLDALPWWTMNSVRDVAATDGTAYALDVQRGGFRHAFGLYMTCGCKDRRPLPADCTCLQEDAFAIVRAAAKGLPPAKPVPAPQQRTFERSPRGAEPRPRECTSTDDGALWCGGGRCIRREGQTADCYPSPVEAGETVTVVAVTAAAKTRVTSKSLPWAVELDDGRVCAQPSPAGGFSCTQDLAGVRAFGSVRPSGNGWVFVAREKRSLTVAPVTAVWP